MKDQIVEFNDGRGFTLKPPRRFRSLDGRRLTIEISTELSDYKRKTTIGIYIKSVDEQNFIINIRRYIYSDQQFHSHRHVNVSTTATS